MLITVLTKRLREFGGPWEGRAFAALDVADAVSRFKGEYPMLIVAPYRETRASGLAENVGDWPQDIHIRREVSIAALIQRGDDDWLAGQAAADTAEAIRDKLLEAFAGFHAAPCIGVPEYLGMDVLTANAQAPVSMVVYRFSVLETLAYDKLLEMGYNCTETARDVTFTVNGMTARIRPNSRMPECGD